MSNEVPTPEQMWGPRWHGWTWDMVTAHRKPIDWLDWYLAQGLHVLAWQKVKWLRELPAKVKCPVIPAGSYVINEAYTYSKGTPPWLLPKPTEWNPNYAMIMHSLEPIVIDLYGNGIKTVNVNQGVFFDHKGDGLAEGTGWVSPGEGLLCMDRNGNGVIDTGSELFGDQTLLPNGQLAADGFQALAALDSNHDGKIDAQDSAYSQLNLEG